MQILIERVYRLRQSLKDQLPEQSGMEYSVRKFLAANREAKAVDQPLVDSKCFKTAIDLVRHDDHLHERAAMIASFSKGKKLTNEQ